MLPGYEGSRLDQLVLEYGATRCRAGPWRHGRQPASAYVGVGSTVCDGCSKQLTVRVPGLASSSAGSFRKVSNGPAAGMVIVDVVPASLQEKVKVATVPTWLL